MEHIDRQAIYFSLNLGAALTSLFTETAVLAWAAGIADKSTAAGGGAVLLLLLAAAGIGPLLWRMPRRCRRQLFLSAAELWRLTAMAALMLLLGFLVVCAGY